jgi:hypothetical protein
MQAYEPFEPNGLRGAILDVQHTVHRLTARRRRS